MKRRLVLLFGFALLLTTGRPVLAAAPPTGVRLLDAPRRGQVDRLFEETSGFCRMVDNKGLLLYVLNGKGETALLWGNLDQARSFLDPRAARSNAHGPADYLVCRAVYALGVWACCGFALSFCRVSDGFLAARTGHMQPAGASGWPKPAPGAPWGRT